MAALAQPNAEAGLDRRMRPRSEVNLGVRLYRVGEEDVIPAAIISVSATGFLVELPGAATMPRQLDVDLPNAGRRRAEVVWQSDTSVGCNFTTPLGRADLSAALLRSAFSEPALSPVAQQGTTPIGPDLSIAPDDPIWDTTNEAGAGERWPLRVRASLIVAAAAAPCALFFGFAMMLV